MLSHLQRQQIQPDERFNQDYQLGLKEVPRIVSSLGLGKWPSKVAVSDLVWPVGQEKTLYTSRVAKFLEFTGTGSENIDYVDPLTFLEKMSKAALVLDQNPELIDICRGLKPLAIREYYRSHGVFSGFSSPSGYSYKAGEAALLQCETDRIPKDLKFFEAGMGRHVQTRVDIYRMAMPEQRPVLTDVVESIDDYARRMTITSSVPGEPDRKNHVLSDQSVDKFLKLTRPLAESIRQTAPENLSILGTMAVTGLLPLDDLAGRSGPRSDPLGFPVAQKVQQEIDLYKKTLSFLVALSDLPGLSETAGNLVNCSLRHRLSNLTLGRATTIIENISRSPERLSFCTEIEEIRQSGQAIGDRHFWHPLFAELLSRQQQSLSYKRADGQTVSVFSALKTLTHLPDYTSLAAAVLPRSNQVLLGRTAEQMFTLLAAKEITSEQLHGIAAKLKSNPRGDLIDFIAKPKTEEMPGQSTESAKTSQSSKRSIASRLDDAIAVGSQHYSASSDPIMRQKVLQVLETIFPEAEKTLSQSAIGGVLALSDVKLRQLERFSKRLSYDPAAKRLKRSKRHVEKFVSVLGDCSDGKSFLDGFFALETTAVKPRTVDKLIHEYLSGQERTAKARRQETGKSVNRTKKEISKQPVEKITVSEILIAGGQYESDKEAQLLKQLEPLGVPVRYSGLKSRGGSAVSVIQSLAPQALYVVITQSNDHSLTYKARNRSQIEVEFCTRNNVDKVAEFVTGLFVGETARYQA